MGTEHMGTFTNTSMNTENTNITTIIMTTMV